MDDVVVKDLRLEKYEVSHLVDGLWQIVTHGADGRLRTAQSNEPGRLLETIWINALLEGATLPSIDQPGLTFNLAWERTQTTYTDRHTAVDVAIDIATHKNIDVTFGVTRYMETLIEVVLPRQKLVAVA
jgi:hypothetical protein